MIGESVWDGAILVCLYSHVVCDNLNATTFLIHQHIAILAGSS